MQKDKTFYIQFWSFCIRIKLELAKLQSDIIKNRGDVDSAISERSNGKASLSDFKSIREMLKENDAEPDNDMNF